MITVIDPHALDANMDTLRLGLKVTAGGCLLLTVVVAFLCMFIVMLNRQCAKLTRRVKSMELNLWHRFGEHF